MQLPNTSLVIFNGSSIHCTGSAWPINHTLYMVLARKVANCLQHSLNFMGIVPNQLHVQAVGIKDVTMHCFVNRCCVEIVGSYRVQIKLKMEQLSITQALLLVSLLLEGGLCYSVPHNLCERFNCTCKRYNFHQSYS